jgi:hypothetical protein
MMKNKLAMAALAAIMTMSLGLATIQPARADQAAVNRNTVLGVAAFLAGVFVATNVANKNAVANTVAGTTRDGATVYEDGHVVLPNGESYYPNNAGQSISCNNGYCSIYADSNGYSNPQNGYNNGYNGGYNNGYNNGGYNNGGYNGGYNGGNGYGIGSNRGRGHNRGH